MEQIIQYGTTSIAYEVTYAKRETLAIHVEPDLSVHVVAPVGTDDVAIAEKIRKRASWIMRQWRELEQYLPQTPPRTYVSGETHLYLGRQYRLKVVSDEIDRVRLMRGYFWVQSTRPQDPQYTAKLLNSWYREKAMLILKERTQACFPRLEGYNVDFPVVELREMKTRWGSCTASGKILLNPVLVQVPKHCIDYVILHELCHLVEHNHGAAYYTLLGQVCPDWRERRKALNQIPIAKGSDNG